MKLSGRIKFFTTLTLVMFVLSAIIAFAAPGDSNDPLITLSYITQTLMPEIDSKIDQKINAKIGSDLDAKISEIIDEELASYTPASSSPSSGGASAESFILVNVRKNQRIIGGEGTEFVVRSGQGVIIATEYGGIAALTAGYDLTNGIAVPLNHHLLVPRNDSRGIKFSTNAIVLIKGTYTVKSK